MSYTSFFSVVILCLINLLNYMDRYTIAGILTQIGDFYSLTESSKGLIQTSFIVSYMIFAPAFGYFGDRYSRKNLMAFGVMFWSATTFFGSYVPRDKAWMFFLFRGLVGIGEASYSTLAPTIIADLYTKDMRTKMLSLFYFAIPVGSGLGYIVGSYVSSSFGHWAYALRVTPALGVILVILLLLVLKEPERGAAENTAVHEDNSTIKERLVYLGTVKSYIWSTVGFTCVCFSIGALAWWAPSYVINAGQTTKADVSEETINFIFGLITFFAGIFGVIIGTGCASWYRKYNARADPIICGIGVLVSVPFAFFAIFLARFSPMTTWICMFLSVTMLCLNWTLVADMLLYLVVPYRRSFAQSIQILISHLLGDALSPYVVGLVSDAVRGSQDTPLARYTGLQYALYINCFILIIGGVSFLYTAFFIVQDVERCKQQSQGIMYSPSETYIDSLSANGIAMPVQCDERMSSFPPASIVEPDTNHLMPAMLCNNNNNKLV